MTCEMEKGCVDPVTHVDRNGFVYCTRHGERRRAWKPCRKLRPHEIKKLERGEPLARY